MKSLNFNVLKKCERIRKLKIGDVFATYRLILPRYEETEIIKIRDKQHVVIQKDLFKKDIKILKPKILYLSEIMQLNPKRIRDLTAEDAKLDLFPELTAKQFQDIFLHLYNNVTPNRWGFQIVLKVHAEYIPIKKGRTDKNGNTNIAD